MEFVVDGAIIILIALIAIISSILLINRRKALAGKADGVEPEARLSGMSAVVETQRASDGGAREDAEARDNILISPEQAQLLPNATAPKSQNGGGASDVASTSEERVTLPI